MDLSEQMLIGKNLGRYWYQTRSTQKRRNFCYARWNPQRRKLNQLREERFDNLLNLLWNQRAWTQCPLCQKPRLPWISVDMVLGSKLRARESISLKINQKWFNITLNWDQSKSAKSCNLRSIFDFSWGCLTQCRIRPLNCISLGILSLIKY